MPSVMMRRRHLLAASAAVLALPLVATAPAPAGAAPTRAAGHRSPLLASFRSPPSDAGCRAAYSVDCYTPAQIARAYGVDRLHAAGTDGRGVTIAVVDSFGSPTIAGDLAAFDRHFGLPDPPSLRTITPAGPVPRYDGSNDRAGWAGETTLDVEWAHVMAPGAAILVVATPTSETEGITGFPDIIKAMRSVISHHQADIISLSLGATEETFSGARQIEALSRSVLPYAKSQGVTVLSSSGDTGPTDYRLDGVTIYRTKVNSWPSSDPLVTSVGGTRLHLAASGARTAPDAAWGGGSGFGAGGGGVSSVFARPSYQSGVARAVGPHRGTPDVSMNAAAESSVDLYSTFDRSSGPWGIAAGTSEAAPLMAGIVALADQQAGGRIGWIDPLLYRGRGGHPLAGLSDVTHGTNTVVDQPSGRRATVSTHGYVATHGYDLATGLGTVDAPTFVPALAQAAIAAHQVTRR